MTDRRLLASNGRVAHVSLQGEVEAERFVEGEARQLRRTAWLRRAPDGAVDRQLLFGDPFLVLEETGSAVFGVSRKDGYVGYVEADALWEGAEPTHRVAIRTTWAWAAPNFKVPPVLDLHMSGEVAVTGETTPWTEIAGPEGPLYVPTNHLLPLAEVEDPVTAAHMMVGTPYVWGGNTGFGIDCSGLVQVAFRAAGRACPPDSDLQMAMEGASLEHGALKRGDLVFWRGHVAMMADEVFIVHANAHHMAVAVEPLTEAIERIKKTDVGEPLVMLKPGD
jgi:hypothetical protein